MPSIKVTSIHTAESQTRFFMLSAYELALRGFSIIFSTDIYSDGAFSRYNMYCCQFIARRFGARLTKLLNSLMLSLSMVLFLKSHLFKVSSERRILAS